MTKRIFLTFVISLLITHTIAQSAEDIVKNIRKQYNEVTIMESAKKSNGCQSGSSKTSRVIMDRNMSFPQSSIKCSYPGGYTVITSKFEDWEFAATVKFYFKNGQLFFVFINSSDVASGYEHRTYYGNGKVIKILEKGGFDAEDSTVNRDITNTKDADFVINFIRDRLIQSNNMIK